MAQIDRNFIVKKIVLKQLTEELKNEFLQRTETLNSMFSLKIVYVLNVC